MDFDSFSWTGVETEHKGRRLLLRFIELPKRFRKSKYPERINIFWKMSEPHEDGLGTSQEHERLASFENRLCGAVHPDEHSILILALTSNGEKEFVFHTGEVTGFMQRLTNMPQETKRYPITLHRSEDPDWAYFKAVTSEFRSH
jgi:hypothetical protein